MQASSGVEPPLAELQERLDEAVTRENYQAAAELRDKITYALSHQHFLLKGSASRVLGITLLVICNTIAAFLLRRRRRGDSRLAVEEANGRFYDAFQRCSVQARLSQPCTRCNGSASTCSISFFPICKAR